MVLSEFLKSACGCSRNTERMKSSRIFMEIFTPFANRRRMWFFGNPPYISPKEYFNIGSFVRDFERAALIAKMRFGILQKLNEALPAIEPRREKYFWSSKRTKGMRFRPLSGPIGRAPELKRWAGYDRFFPELNKFLSML